jgi:hypothetical protein
MSQERVEAVMGVADRRRRDGDRQTWTYEGVYQQRGDTVSVLGIVPVRRPERDRYKVTLSMGASGLERAVLDEQLSGDKPHRRTLIPQKWAF